MSLQQKMKSDLTAAMKAKDDVKKDAIRVIMGELGRLEQKKLTDEQVTGILKKLLKSEREVLQQQGKSEDSGFITVVESYMPRQAEEDEIAAWIQENVDFSSFKNKMQAMGMIMKHFGQRADGNVVKGILQKM